MAHGLGTPPAGRARRWWWVSTITVISSFILGFVAFCLIPEPKRGLLRFVEALYSSAQLLILHVPLEYLESHKQFRVAIGLLHVARFLAVVAVGTTGVAILAEFFGEELRRSLMRGHVVICGLGDVGLRLALQGRQTQHKKQIIAIEKSCPTSLRQFMRDQGVIVLDGDANDEGQLRRARVERADFVVATCRDDETNVAIAAAVGRVLASSRQTRKIVCRTLIRNPQTRHLLAQQRLLPAGPSGYTVNFSDLDRHAVAARQAFRRYPLDFAPIREQDDTVVCLVVVGFGMAAQSLAVHAAQIGHFANEVGRLKRRLRLIIVDANAEAVQDFQRRYDKMETVCDVELAQNKPEKAVLASWLAELPSRMGSSSCLLTYAFCGEDPRANERNFRYGLELAQLLKGRTARVLIHQNTSEGFARLLSDEGGSRTVAGRVHTFGMVEDVFNWDVLLHESEDSLARALHEDYRARRLEQGDSPHQHPVWEELGDDLKESNRQAADHIPIKLRALGYHEEPLRKDKPRITHFEQDEVDLLARMEHARWCAERYLAGWNYAEKTDREKKLNRCLVAWDRLPPEERRKDPEQINSISSALYRIGLGIYR